MIDYKKKAFTLAEVMIVFTVIGILTAILVPTIFSASPDQEKLKAKKAFNTLTRAVENLTNGAYEVNDGILDATTIVDDTDAQKQLFCNNLVEVLNVKSADCAQNNVNANNACNDTDDNNNTVCEIDTKNVNGTITLDYSALQEKLDTICENLTEVGTHNFVTADNVKWDIQLNDFSDSATVTAGGIPSPSFYNVVCINTNKDSDEATTEYIFGAGVRRDGKVLVGTKLQEILNSADDTD